MESEIALTTSVWLAAGVAILAAGVTQGALGFGFPTISTPVLVLVTDVKTAIILNLMPNSYLGARFLIVAPQEPIRLLLALIIFAYLFQQKLARLDWSWLTRYRRISQCAFGMTGGFFSGSVNNSLPPLLIYFILLGVEVAVMTQILNLCFLGGKVVQAATLGFSGEIDVTAALANIPLTLIGLIGMYAGTRLQKRFSPQAYNRALRVILFAIALMLVWQGGRYFFS